MGGVQFNYWRHLLNVIWFDDRLNTKNLFHQSGHLVLT